MGHRSARDNPAGNPRAYVQNRCADLTSTVEYRSGCAQRRRHDREDKPIHEPARVRAQHPGSPAKIWRLGLGTICPPGIKVALATVILDQANKLWMILVYGIEGRGRVEVTPFLDFVYVLNTGVSYSMFDSSSYSWQLGLAAFAFAAALAMWIWLCKGGRAG